MTRKQELFLISLGLDTLIERASKRSKEKIEAQPKKRKHKWSDAQREKFSKSMAKVWAAKKAGK